MNRRQVIQSALLLMLILVLSAIPYELCLNLFTYQPYLDAKPFEFQVELIFFPKLYFQFFFYFLILIGLPYSYSFMKSWLIANAAMHSWIIASIEGIAVFLAYFCTPPDLMSTLLYFAVWQLVVLVNYVRLNNLNELKF